MPRPFTDVAGRDVSTQRVSSHMKQSSGPATNPTPDTACGPTRARGTPLGALAAAASLATALAWPSFASAADDVLNLYSARHYQTDEALYKDFTDATGIRINRIELGDEALLERLRSEGDKSPADVVLLVDASRLWKAQSQNLFRPVKSATLEQRIPAEFRASDDSWFGFSSRARLIVYNKATVKPADVDSYEALADPKNKGRLCTRSGSHPYNLSLFASLLERHGEAKTRDLLKGYVANMARAPKGGDTDQIRAVASGECGVALTNSYYWVRLLKSTKAQDRDVVSRVVALMPNQASSGTQMNLAGGAVARHAPHPEAAVRFLEYLASDKAQTYFAAGNNEWPVVASARAENPALASLGDFKQDRAPVDKVGKRTGDAQKLLDQVGYR
ncbi:MAG: extracellular solute-binding protein [Lautropia sp.]